MLLHDAHAPTRKPSTCAAPCNQIVGKRPTTIPSFVPTWENVRLYFNAYMQDYLARIGSNEAFNIPEQVPRFQGGLICVRSVAQGGDGASTRTRAVLSCCCCAPVRRSCQAATALRVWQTWTLPPSPAAPRSVSARCDACPGLWP